MMRQVSCILLLKWPKICQKAVSVGVMSPMHKKESHLRRARDKSGNFWFHVSPMDGSVLPQDDDGDQLSEVNWLNMQQKSYIHM